MMRREILRSVLLVWLGLLVMAFTLGALREVLLVPRVGPHAAHQVGTFIGCLMVALVSFAMVRRIAPTEREALGAGLLWVLLTIAFEFGFFHYVAGRSWESLLAEYNLVRGKLWPVFLLTVLLAPYLCAKLRNTP